MSAGRNAVNVVKKSRGAVGIGAVARDDAGDVGAVSIIIVHALGGHEAFGIHHVWKQVQEAEAFRSVPVRS